MPRIPKSRVELHLHLDGAVRITTLWELARKRGLSLPGSGTLDDLHGACVVKEPQGLAYFIEKIVFYLPYLVGDLDAIERVAYELCEDEGKNGVIYFEARYCPHLLTDEKKGVTNDLVVQSVNRGLKRGERDFAIKARSILCCITEKPEWSLEMADLCIKYKNDGVVGLDIAGDEKTQMVDGKIVFHPNHVAAFKKAAEHGIHRTVHAGEVGPAEGVEAAVDQLGAERIGHGYHVLDDEAIYKRMFKLGIHFEMCPHSSLLTGAVSKCVSKHPLVRMAEDGSNFSINSDDPTVTGTYVNEDFQLAWQWGLTERHLVSATFNAALSSFLPDDEKQELITKLASAFGIPAFLAPLGGTAAEAKNGDSTAAAPSITTSPPTSSENCEQATKRTPPSMLLPLGPQPYRRSSNGSPLPSPIGSPILSRHAKPYFKLSAMKDSQQPVVNKLF